MQQSSKDLNILELRQTVKTLTLVFPVCVMSMSMAVAGVMCA